MLLARLEVSKTWKGMGVGAGLLKDALQWGKAGFDDGPYPADRLDDRGG